MHASARSVCRVSEATRGVAAAEIELMQPTERVAPLRRQLPAGPVVEDYAFQEGPGRWCDTDLYLEGLKWRVRRT